MGIIDCTTARLSRRKGPPRPLRCPPVDPFQEHRQLRRRQRHLPLLGRRPDEPTLLKPLHKHAGPLAIPPDHFDQIARSAFIPHTNCVICGSNILGTLFTGGFYARAMGDAGTDRTLCWSRNGRGSSGLCPPGCAMPPIAHAWKAARRLLLSKPCGRLHRHSI